LATAVGIGHPSGHEYPTIVGLKFELQCIASTEPSGNRQFSTVAGMKGVVNRDVARIAGIVTA
jgi:hypothetical protein